MTPSQCRAARGLLDWTQAQLAESARVGLSTVRGFETGKKTPVLHNFEAIQSALVNAGIEFLGDETSPGVRLLPKAA
jgi:transcriptional regulator with XRE-family HTH domain